MNVYIDLMSATTGGTYAFSENDLEEIGPFTRENVQRWKDSDSYARRELFVHAIVMGPIIDFHAVSGTVEIPWALEDSAARWERMWETRRLEREIAERERVAFLEKLALEREGSAWKKFCH